MIKAIVFDVDDTLLMTSKVRYEALKYLGREYYGLELTNEQIRAHWGEPFDEFMRNLFGEGDTVEKMKANYLLVVEKFPNKPYPDALETVRQLLMDYKVGILSMSGKELVRQDLIRCGFGVEQFFYVQGAEDTTAHKPDPLVFGPILQLLEQNNI